jgi:hypothetical protein
MADDQVNRIMADIEELTSEQVLALIFGIHGRLVQDTPVDTGWAANNWIPAQGQPARGTVGTPQELDATAATQALASIEPGSLTSRPTFISNNVPYIARLNAGSSRQAPAGFVDKIVQDEVAKANARRLR